MTVETLSTNVPNHQAQEHREKFYGRRKGRPLRKTGQNLVETLLPSISFSKESLKNPQQAFLTKQPELWLEIGFGGGEHVCAQARAHPNVNIIGAEPFLNGISLLLKDLDEKPCPNLRLWPEDVRPLLEALPDGCLSRVFLLFPDPWPKKRHFKRRFLNPTHLATLARLIRPGGQLRLATDHSDYRTWMLEHMARDPNFKPLFDPASPPTTRPTDAFPTRYEAKALRQGIVCTYKDYARVE